MIAPWVKEEMAEARLGDKRLDRRLMMLLSAFGERPQASIPAACGGWNETSAAYRFFDNEKVTPEEILASHFTAPPTRIREQAVALLTQDTTELDFTRPHTQMAGSRPLDGSSRRGAFAHPVAAFTPEGVPLGCIRSNYRADESDNETQISPQRRKRSKATTPMEQGEYALAHGAAPGGISHNKYLTLSACASPTAKRISMNCSRSRAVKCLYIGWCVRVRMVRFSRPRYPCRPAKISPLPPVSRTSCNTFVNKWRGTGAVHE